MKALIFEGDGKYSIKQVPIPEVKSADEVLLKIEACSICGTDVHILDTPPGHPANIGVVLGHEMIGEICKKGDGVSGYELGDRVGLDPNLFCGNCMFCKKGNTNLCEHNTCLGIFLDGGFAEYCVVPEKALIKVPNDLPIEKAIFIEPLAGVVHAVSKLTPRVGETALVMGAGPIGLYFIQMLKASGVKKIIAVELSEFRAGFARELGADIVIDPRRDDMAAIIAEETQFGADITVDCVGTLINDAIEYTRPGGKILLFGINWSKQQTFNQAKLTRKDLTVFGNYVSAFKYFDTVNILSSDILQLEKMVTHKLVLDDIAVGLEAMRRGEALEVIVFPNEIPN